MEDVPLHSRIVMGRTRRRTYQVTCTGCQAVIEVLMARSEVGATEVDCPGCGCITNTFAARRETSIVGRILALLVGGLALVAFSAALI